MKHRLITQDWDKYSGMHPTMELDHVSTAEMRKIYIQAYISFYVRPKKLLENLSYVVRLTPVIVKQLLRDLVKMPLNLAPRPRPRQALLRRGTQTPQLRPGPPA